MIREGVVGVLLSLFVLPEWWSGVGYVLAREWGEQQPPSHEFPKPMGTERRSSGQKVVGWSAKPTHIYRCLLR